MHFQLLDAMITIIAIWGSVWAFQLANKGKDQKNKPQQKNDTAESYFNYKQQLKQRKI